MKNETGFYVYSEYDEQIAYVNAPDIIEAYKEAERVTGLPKECLSVERA